MYYAINEHTKEHRVIRGSAQAVAFSIIEDWHVVEADSDGWIPWRGGVNPLPNGAPVEVRRRDGCIVRRNSSETFSWRELDNGYTIDAYRPILGDKEQDVEREYWFEMDEDWRGPQYGLPPIGIEVEVRRCDSDWRKATVVGHDGCRVIVRMNTDAIVYDWAVGSGIRPLRTAAQRAEEEAVEAMYDYITGPKAQASAIYAAIREGRIPGVKLET